MSLPPHLTHANTSKLNVLWVAAEAYGDPELAQDLKRGIKSLSALLANASRAARRVDSAVGHLEALLREVRTGDGTAHALIYGDEGATALRELGEAAGQLAEHKKNGSEASHV